MDMASVSFALNNNHPSNDSDQNASKCARAYQTTSCTRELEHNPLRSP